VDTQRTISITKQIPKSTLIRLKIRESKETGAEEIYLLAITLRLFLSGLLLNAHLVFPLLDGNSNRSTPIIPDKLLTPVLHQLARQSQIRDKSEMGPWVGFRGSGVCVCT
jgi:hypothetical protein